VPPTIHIRHLIEHDFSVGLDGEWGLWVIFFLDCHTHPQSRQDQMQSKLQKRDCGRHPGLNQITGKRTKQISDAGTTILKINQL